MMLQVQFLIPLSFTPVAQANQAWLYLLSIVFFLLSAAFS